MSVFKSQFDRARPYTEEHAGDARDPVWRSPAVIGAVVGGGAAVAAAMIPVVAGDDKAAAAEPPAEQSAGDQGAWGEGWEAGWESPASGASGPPASGDGNASWMDRGEYTDAGVGGDEDFFYFIDGDSSATVE
jgi:hypothetical protein